MDSVLTDGKWLRPKILRPPDCEEEPIIFQQIDIDHYEGLKREGFLGPDSSLVQVTRMFGVTRDGNSILCHVHGFHPYFYVYTAKRPDLTKLEAFRQMLNDRCKAHGGSKMSPLPQLVLRVEYVPAKSIHGYSGTDEQHLLKIVVIIPSVMRVVQSVFAKGQADSMGVYFVGAPDEGNQQIYETNIDYEIRYMSDLNIYGCSWIELPPGKYKLREQKDFMSSCQLECDVNYTDFIPHPPEGEWAGIAPLRTLSFDIEAKVRGHLFPQPQHDAVIQISSAVVKQGVEEPFIKCIFTLRSCAPIAGATVISFETESEMLLAWSKFVVQIDPDIMTGYNIRTFDFRYLLNRANFLKLTKFPYLGRIPTSLTKVRNVKAQSNQRGKHESLDVNIEGRVQFDLIIVMRRDYRLQSYKLNSVSEHFLKEQKEDVHFSIITDLFNGDEHTRRRLAVYCLKDSVLVLRLIEKLACLASYMKTARVAGVPLAYLLSRDPQLKAISQNLREAKKNNHVLPDKALIAVGSCAPPPNDEGKPLKRIRVA